MYMYNNNSNDNDSRNKNNSISNKSTQMYIDGDSGGLLTLCGRIELRFGCRNSFSLNSNN